MATDRRNSRVDRVVGQVIAAARARMGVSQEVLAERAHLHPTYISQLERGLKSPTIRVFLAIGAGLELGASALVGEIESELSRLRLAAREVKRRARSSTGLRL